MTCCCRFINCNKCIQMWVMGEMLSGKGYVKNVSSTPFCSKPQTAFKKSIKFFFLSFQGHTQSIWRFPGQGLNQNYSCWPIAQPQQFQILNPLSEARDQTCNLMAPSQSHFCCPMMRTPYIFLSLKFDFTLGSRLWSLYSFQ